MLKNSLLIWCLCLINISAQQIPQNTTRGNSPQTFVMNNHNEAEKDDEIIKLIVEFTDPPAVMLSPSVRKMVKKNSRTQQFSEDLQKMSAKVGNRLNKISSEGIKINKEFYKLFSGVQIDVPRKYLSYISGLSYVKKIHVDQEIHADLSESVPLVKADQIWSTLNNRGKGIKISIIDTGIDYLHEALGGGFGAGFKVLGGHDFVNNDNDPMDDNGHGTHVAGITAANSSTLLGVAPEASLIACKILNAQGSGYTSSIVDAIEYSIDPNNDGNYSDAADVINLSLGGPGTPDDPSSQAVNNASSLGIVVCIAAGNSGSQGFHTIGSPGCAAGAITVGNVTKLKELNYSSSKGPNTGNFNIKPDLLAPGTDINSCKISGGIISLSGTSMSAPHIAGICALIKKQHPEWTSEEIKSALKTTAEKLNYEPMQQGSGLVDALKAMNIKTLVVPSDLSFGLCDTVNTIWHIVKTVKIKNINSLLQQYNVNILSSYPGITFDVSNPGFSLPPGDSAEININMAVDNNIVAFNNSGSNSYSGYFKITGTLDTLSLPWAFVKRQMIELRFEKPNANFSLATNGKQYNPWDADWVDLYIAHLNVPNGNYDLISCMLSNDTLFYSIKENLNLTGANVITVLKSESVNEIHLDGKDEYGRKIKTLMNQNFALNIYDKTKLNFLCFFNQGNSFSSFISNLPEDYLLYSYQYCKEKDTIRVISHEPVSNQTSDIILSNIPSDLVKQKIKIIFAINAVSPGIGLWSNMSYKNSNIFAVGMGDIWDTVVTKNYWEGYVVRNERICNNPSFEFQLEAWNKSLLAGNGILAFVTSPMWAKNKQFFMSPNNIITPDLFIEESSEKSIVIGDNILFPLAEYNVTSNYFSVTVDFLGQLKERKNISGNGYVFKAYNFKDEIIDSGKTSGFNYFYTFYEDNFLKTEYYRTDHSRFTDSSLAKLTSIIRNYTDDLTPPVLTSFQVRNSEGKPTDVIAKDEPFQIRFSLKDPNLNIDSIKIEIKDYYSDVWKSCTYQEIAEHELIGKLFSATPDSTQLKDINLLSMRLSYQDKNGNAGIWLLDPAILIGEPVTPVELLSFSAIQKDNNIILNWSTATETNNSGFEIERRLIKNSEEGDWTKIGFVNGSGSSTERVNYSYTDNSTKYNCNKIKYRLKQIDLNGTFSFSNEITTTIDLPLAFTLSQNYPNPFNSTTIINYQLPDPGVVSLRIFNIMGEEVKQVINEYKESGRYSTEFNADGLASGIYFYKITSGNFSQTKKLVLLK